ncbi:NACHT N-terminal Helical domain 1-containing protein [Streptomyces youssoufiensis]
MEPTVAALRLASGLVAPIVRKLFVTEEPGAGVVRRPVRISSLVSFHGEHRTLGEAELDRLAGTLVARALESAGPGERPVAVDGARRR